MPSSAPVKPSFSSVVALTLTQSVGISIAAASVMRIFYIYGDSLGF